MLLARLAEATYWTGRYLERAEDMARIVAVHGETHIDLPVGEDVGWGPLIDIAGERDLYDERYGRPGAGTPGAPPRAPSAVADEGRIVAFVLTDRSNPSSIASSIAGARANLRLARPVVPARCGSSATGCGSPRGPTLPRSRGVRTACAGCGASSRNASA